MSVTITQVGYLPPPYGGVSVHMQRLRGKLERAGIIVLVWLVHTLTGQGTGVYVLPVRKRPMCWIQWIINGFRRVPGEIVHFHVVGPHSFLIWSLVHRGRNVVITIHNQFVLEERGFYQRLTRLVIRLVGADSRFRVIAVNSRIVSQLMGLGVPSSQISLIPAYLALEGQVNTASLPDEVLKFADRHRPLLTVYGIKCHPLSAGGDLYGFDISLDAFKTIKETYTGAGLIVLSPNNEKNPYFQDLLRKAQKLGVLDAILWWTAPIPDARPLWKCSDVYLRPTSTDGDAIAVREALAMGTPVVASDVCERPDKTTLFQAGNVEAFTSAIISALTSGRLIKEADERDYFGEIIRVYSALLPNLTSLLSEGGSGEVGVTTENIGFQGEVIRAK